MASSSSRGRKRSKLTAVEDLERSFPTLHWRQIHSMCLNPPLLPAQVEGRASFLPSATVMHPSTPDNPSIEDLHNSELVNGRWRLKPAVVEKRLLQKAGGRIKKGSPRQGRPPAGLPRVQEKTQGKRKDLETKKEKLDVLKLNTKECSEDLNQKMDVDANPGEAAVMFAGEEGGGNVVKKLVVKKVKKKKMLDRKVNITKPAGRLDRKNNNQAGSLENTGNGGKKSFPCTEQDCNKEFALKAKLFNHMRQKHSYLKLDKKKGGKAENNEGMCVEGEPHNCKECEKKFSRKDSLKRHLLVIHRGVKLHQCQKCNMKFGQKNDLKKHLQCQHGGKKLFNAQSKTEAKSEGPTIESPEEEAQLPIA